MFYTVYKTTNLLNNKTYIGVHKTKNLNDDYIGSGKILKAAIKKYGLVNFKKEILYVFDNSVDMYKKEAELVNENLVNNTECYNVKLGGYGGWDYINSDSDIRIKRSERLSILSEKSQPMATHAFNEKYMCDEVFRETHRSSVIVGLKKYYSMPNSKSGFRGKKHSEQTLSKMRKPKNVGHKNPQFGTMWITNGIESRKIKKSDIIPLDWYKGRKMIYKC